MVPVTPFPYFGGKFYALNILLPIIHNIPHRVYVGPFGGSGVVLINKNPSPVEVFNDLDENIVNFFLVVADPERFERMRLRLALLPYSRKLYYRFMREYMTESDPVERAVKWFYVVRSSFSGCVDRGGWSFSVTKSNRGMSSAISKYLTAVDRLEFIHRRLQRVQFECLDFEKVFDLYDTPQTLFFVDPPYIGASDSYSVPFSLDDHRRLVEVLLRTKGSWVMTCYDHEIYRPLDRVAEKKTRKLPLFSVGRTRAIGELGDGFLERVGGYSVETIYIRRNEQGTPTLWGTLFSSTTKE